MKNVVLLLLISAFATTEGLRFLDNSNNVSIGCNSQKNTLQIDVKCSASLPCKSLWQYCYDGKCVCGEVPWLYDFGMPCGVGKKHNTFLCLLCH